MIATRVTSPFGFESTAAEVIAGIDLRGRRALVTGAASGIGVETARALASAGAETVERGSGGLLGQLLSIEGEIATPEGPPVVPIVVAQCPDGAHTLSFASAGAWGRDRLADPFGRATTSGRAPCGPGGPGRRISRGPGPAGPGARGG